MVFRKFFGKNFFFVHTPTGRKGNLVVFWPLLALGTLVKFQARAENTKMQFSGARGTFGGGIRPPQKFLPEIGQFSYGVCFGRPDPQGREIAKYCFFRPFWHLDKFRAENRETQFPAGRGTFEEKVQPPQRFSPQLANFFTFSVLADRTPRDIGKSQNIKFYTQHTARCTYRDLVGTESCTILGALILCTQIKCLSTFGSTNNRQIPESLHCAYGNSRKSRESRRQQIPAFSACGKLPQIARAAS